jgi:hypothetical protein
MATPTDRGIAFVGRNDDGTSNVYVAVGVDASAKPLDVFAVHFRRTTVTVDPGVRMVNADTMQRSAGSVHVWADDNGEVHIKAPVSNLGSLVARI